MTRWHGTTIGIGLAPFAAPTARTACRRADGGGDLEVTPRLAVRDPFQFAPDALLKCGALHVQGQIEVAQFAGEIGSQLPRRLEE